MKQTKKIHPEVSEYYRKLGKRSAEVREKRIIEEAKKVASNPKESETK